MKLTNIACKNALPAEKARKLSDGGGLYLEVMPNGAKYWRMKYRFLGKEKRLAIGVYPAVSLIEARDECRIAKKLLAEGKDPSEEKKLSKLERQTRYENNFENIAREWHTHKIHTWKLAHAERNQIRAAYNHAEYLKERAEMMQWWADYIDSVTQKTARKKRVSNA